MSRARRAALAPGAWTHCESCKTPLRAPRRQWIVLVPFVLASIALSTLAVAALGTRPLVIQWWYVALLSTPFFAAGWNASTRLASRTPLSRGLSHRLPPPALAALAPSRRSRC
jgi:hypothetical protein